MEMSPRQSTLLLTVAAAVMVISAQSLILDEKETRKVDVHLGSSQIFYCGLREIKLGGFFVTWFFNPNGSSFNEKHEISKEVVNKSTNTSTEASSKTKQNFRDDTKETFPKFSLSNATHNDSGWYFCQITVDIPMLQVKRSQGVEVVVRMQSLFHSITMKTITEHTTYKSQVPVSPSLLDGWWMVIVLAASCLVLIVLLMLIYLCVTGRLRRSREECPIYANMHQRSPRPGTPAADTLKTVSSSQNLRTPSPGRTYDEGKRRYKY